MEDIGLWIGMIVVGALATYIIGSIAVALVCEPVVLGSVSIAAVVIYVGGKWSDKKNH